MSALRSVFRKTFGALFLTLAIAGFVTVAVDPMQWIAPLLPTTVFGLLYVDQAYVQGLLTTLDTNQIALSAAIGVCSLLMLVGGILLVQHPIYAITSIGRGIKSSPMAFFRSPITAYRRLIRARNWLLAKVEFLQSESAKFQAIWNIAKSPYTVLRSLGFSPQMAIGLLAIGGTAGGGVIVNETLLSERSFTRGDSGVYEAPVDVPVEWVEGSNTLRVDLGTTPVGLLELVSISAGTSYANSALPSGEANAVILGGLPGTTSPAFTETYLEVGELYIEKWRCSKLSLDNIEVNHLIITKTAADGISHAMVAGTPRARGISGGVRAEEMKVSNSTYDQIKITAATSGVNGRVDEIRMVNIWTKNPCVISRVKAGTITITLSEFGNGDGLAVKDFTIATSVVYQTLTADQNIEILISPPA
jgi:hypothetical protein